jgi:hypothetical protein
MMGEKINDERFARVSCALVPAFAGMTSLGVGSFAISNFVIPAKAGTQREKARAKRSFSRAPID